MAMTLRDDYYEFSQSEIEMLTAQVAALEGELREVKDDYEALRRGLVEIAQLFNLDGSQWDAVVKAIRELRREREEAHGAGIRLNDEIDRLRENEELVRDFRAFAVAAWKAPLLEVSGIMRRWLDAHPEPHSLSESQEAHTETPGG